MTSSIAAVIFDFGGVFTASPLEAFDRAAAQLNMSGEVMREILLGPYHEDTDHPMHQLERGELDVRAANEGIARLAREAGEDFDLRMLGRVISLGEARKDMIARARKLKVAGYKLGLLTNNVREFGETWKKMLPVEELFDSVIDSSAVGMRKPNPSIYRHALEELGVRAEQALFIDDFESNVLAARSVGMPAMQMKPGDEDRVLSALDELIASGG